jgi:NADH:ubiquinone reductase (H+-translocating)
MPNGKTKKTVVVLGAGYGGVAVVQTLLKQVAGKVTIVLIDRHDYHSYTSDYYEVATAFMEETKDGMPASSFREMHNSASIPLKDIFPEKNVTLLQGEAENINFDAKQVLLKDGQQVAFDFLVVALGSESNFFGMDHLRAFALELKTADDAMQVRDAVDELFLKTPRNKPIRIVVGGGGFTGCEFAGELIGYVKKLARVHGHPKGKVTVSIVEAGPSILGGVSPWGQKKASARLTSLGIKINVNAMMSDVTQEEIVLKDGKKIGYDLLVWTAGIKANRFADALSIIEHSPKQSLVVDETLRFKGQPTIYSVGDIAFYTDPVKKSPLPPTAQVAISQGKHAGQNILRQLRKQKPMAYVPKYPKFLIPLGSKYAVADLGFMRFTGWPAWFLKRLGALRYFLSLVSYNKAIALWRKDLVMYTKND